MVRCSEFSLFFLFFVFFDGADNTFDEDFIFGLIDRQDGEAFLGSDELTGGYASLVSYHITTFDLVFTASHPAGSETFLGREGRIGHIVTGFELPSDIGLNFGRDYFGFRFC